MFVKLSANKSGMFLKFYAFFQDVNIGNEMVKLGHAVFASSDFTSSMTNINKPPQNGNGSGDSELNWTE